MNTDEKYRAALGRAWIGWHESIEHEFIPMISGSFEWGFQAGARHAVYCDALILLLDDAQKIIKTMRTIEPDEADAAAEWLEAVAGFAAGRDGR